MRVIDGNHDLIKSRKFTVQEVVLLVAELRKLVPHNPLLSRSEAADYINSRTRNSKSYTAKALANLASRGMGPPYCKLGNETFYAENDIEGWIYKQRIVPKGYHHDKESE